MQLINSGRTYGLLVLATLISCFIAFYNNYPLVYPDTGSYLHSGWEPAVFIDRTSFYGMFLYYASYKGLVMPIVLAQGLLVCYLLLKLFGIFFSGMQRNVLYLGAVGFVTLFTGFSYNVSVLLPDIFAAIGFLAMFLLLVSHTLNFFERMLIAGIYVFSICTQLSALPIVMLVLFFVLLFLLWQLIKKQKSVVNFKRFIFVGLLTVSSLFIIPWLHYKIDGKYKISGGSHVFVMNHLIEQSVLDEYLKENCASKNYKLCAYKDSIAYLGWDFMWAQKSPLYRTGGWEANEAEYNAIIRDILSTPKYRNKVFFKGIEYSLKQFFTFHTTVSPPLLEGSAPYGQVQWRLPDTAKEYISSRQSTNRLDLGFVNATELPVFMISLVIALLLLFSPGYLQQLLPSEKWLLALLMVYMVLSAILCSNLSTVHARFQNRIVWLLPIAVAMVLIRLFNQKRALQKAK